MIKIGLTGPTGAGKSTVAAYLADAGLPLIDADRIAREITLPGAPALPRLADAFGADTLLPDGTLDRKKLAGRAFSSPENTAKLNAITHPAILQRIHEAFEDAAGGGAKAVILDAPLLFETALDQICDHTVAVLASEEIRLARIRARDGLNDRAAALRMQAQPPEAFYVSHAEIVLRNDGCEAALREQAEALLQKIGRWCL